MGSAASIAGTKSRKCLDELLLLLDCPVELQANVSAVTLIPCCHKVSEKFAKTVYGSTDDGKARSLKDCPLCQTLVDGYYPDHTMRNIVQKVLELKTELEQEKKTASATPAVTVHGPVQAAAAPKGKLSAQSSASSSSPASLSSSEEKSEKATSTSKAPPAPKKQKEYPPIIEPFPQSILTEELSAEAIISATAKDFDKAVKIAKKIFNQHQQSLVLMRIVEKMAEEGLTKQGYSIAQRIGDDPIKSSTLRLLCKSMAHAGIFRDALPIASEISSQYEQSRALYSIAKEMSFAGRVDDARKVIETIPNQAIKDKALLIFHH